MQNITDIKLEENFELKNDIPVPSIEDWQKLVEAELKGADFHKKMFTATYEGIELKPIYTKNDLKANKFVDQFAGSENFIRGNRASGYHSNSWAIAIEAEADTPEKLNHIIKNDIEKGANAINIIAKDLFDSPQNLEIIFNGIDINKYPIFIHTGESNFQVVNSLKLFCDKTKANKNKLVFGLLADPVTSFAVNGKFSKPVETVFEEIAFAIEWLSENFNNAKSLMVNGFTFHNAGASSVQELSIILSIAVEYFDNLQSKGISIDEIAKSIFVQTGISSNYFMEISKIRALRLLWKTLMSSFNVSEEFQKAFIHAKTSSSNQTICDSHVNLLRTTTEAFSAIIGGVESLHTNSFDELYEKQNDFSRRLARNTQIILKEESHLDEVIDPAGGSYFVETLTNQIAESAWKEFQNIQKMGGLFKALEAEYIQNEIDRVVQLKTKDVKSRKSIIVGSNMYANPKEKDVFDKVKSVRGENQITSSIKLIKQFRPAMYFEELRVKGEKYSLVLGKKPKVFLMNIGTLKQYKPRADFSRAFFEIGGFDVIYNVGFKNGIEAATAFNQSDSDIFVICSTDETYQEIVPDVLKKINRPAIKILAGFPKEQVEMYKQNGIDEFIYLGCDTYSTLKSIYKKLDDENF